MVFNAATDPRDAASARHASKGVLKGEVGSPRSGSLVESLKPSLRRGWDQLLVHARKDKTGANGMKDISFNYMNLYENLSGRWKKAPEQCTSMQRAYELSNLSWILRKAVNFLKYLEVESTPDSFKTKMKAGGILDVVECYPWSGERKIFPRRDKRRGKMSASVRLMQDGIFVDCEWGAPYAGKATDQYTLSNDGKTLTLRSVLFFHDANEETEYTNVFIRE